MEKIFRNSIFFCLVVIVALLIFNSCSSTKYVGKDKYLLNKVVVNTVDGKGVSDDEIMANVRQTPNVKILGMFRFQLGLYNLSGKSEGKWYNDWFRKIGEPPVVYDEYLTEKSVEQIKLYLKNKGYFKAEVSDTVIIKKNKKAKVIYNIRLNRPYTIRKFDYVFNDTVDDKGYRDVRNLILKDANKCLVEGSSVMNINTMGEEIDRIAGYVRDKGYYNFSDSYLHFYADTAVGNREADVSLKLGYEKGKKTYKRYRYRNIYINMNYDPRVVVDTVLRSKVNYDTVSVEGKTVIYKDKLYMKPDVIMDALRFDIGDYYNSQAVERSYVRLQSLQQFKFTNIKFVDANGDGDEGALDTYIQLSPLNTQKYSVMVEGTNSGGNIGMAGNLNYIHRNIFKGAETFSVTLLTSLEKERIKADELFSTREFGVKTKLISPQFILPFIGLTDFRKKYSPQTVLSMMYNSQETYYFTRRMVGASFGYSWKQGKNWRYNFNPVDLDFVRMKDVDSDFIKTLENEYIRNSYTDHMIMSSNLSVIYSSDREKSYRSNNYWNLNLESAGNLLHLIDNGFGKHETVDEVADGEKDKYFSYWGIRYAQYVKGDIEYRYNHVINSANSVVARLFVGAAYPYGNLKVLPFEKMYYCGGANGIRAWQVRTLGPGSYSPENKDVYPNQVSDMKIEGNVEYRFKFFGKMHGALFVDAGNIWVLNERDKSVGADFDFSRFYKEIAVGTGFGLRYDFNFFVLRLDAGIKVVDPQRKAGERWVFMKEGYNKIDDMTLNIGIGYPF